VYRPEIDTGRPRGVAPLSVIVIDTVIPDAPAVIRPDRTVYTIVHTFNGTYADLSIDPSGQVRVIDPRPPMGKDYSFVSLEGVTYHP